MLTGTDIPELKADDLEYALRLLDVNDVVFGPTIDEGYYLVGMKRPIREVFERRYTERGKFWNRRQSR